jgi:hypothetical protein
MPQLPSGRHVGLSQDRLYDWAEQAGFTALAELVSLSADADDLHPLIDLIEYEEGHAAPDMDNPDRGEPYISEVRIADLDTAECPWPKADQQALLAWLKSERTRAWLGETLDELREMLASKPAPSGLRGSLDG